MKCLETRRTPEGFRRRRYQRDDGVRFSTIEVPAELWKFLNNPGRGRNRLAEILRERDREARRITGRALLAQGWKPLAVANQLGLTERTVQQWAEKAKS